MGQGLAIWTQLCDDGEDVPTDYAEVVELLFRTDSALFLDDLVAMAEPSLEPYQDLL